MKKLFFLLFPTWSNPADEKKISRLNDKIGDIGDAMITMNRSHKTLERECHAENLRLYNKMVSNMKIMDDAMDLIHELKALKPEKKFDPLFDGKWYMVWDGNYYQGFGFWKAADKKFYKPVFGYCGQTEKFEITGTDWLLIDINHIQLSETTIF